MSRTTIFSAAPDGTVAAVYLQSNETTAPYLSKLLHSVPLISNRSLEIDDILEITAGELAIFITENGDRSVAIRADEKELESLGFDKLGITAQKNGNFTLLSETLASISGIDTSHSNSLFPSFSGTWIGSIWAQEFGHGDIHVTNNAVKIEFETKKQDKLDTIGGTAPVIHALITQEQIDLPETFFEFFPYFTLINELIVDETGVLVALIKGTLDEQSLIEQLQIISAANNPSTFSRTMIDGSSYNELQIDPSLVTVEEISIAGNRIFRAGSLFGLLQDGRAVISTSNEVMESFLRPTDGDGTQCDSASIVISPKQLLENIESEFIDPRLTVLSIIDRFSVITLEKKKYSNIITLWGKDCG